MTQNVKSKGAIHIEEEKDNEWPKSNCTITATLVSRNCNWPHEENQHIQNRRLLAILDRDPHKKKFYASDVPNVGVLTQTIKLSLGKFENMYNQKFLEYETSYIGTGTLIDEQRQIVATAAHVVQNQVLGKVK